MVIINYKKIILQTNKYLQVRKPACLFFSPMEVGFEIWSVKVVVKKIIDPYKN